MLNDLLKMTGVMTTVTCPSKELEKQVGATTQLFVTRFTALTV